MSAYAEPTSKGTSASAHVIRDTRSALYWRLLPHSDDRRNDHLLARMIASMVCGDGAMPRNLGFSASEYRALLDHHFPGAVIPEPPPECAPCPQGERHQEWTELFVLLAGHKAGNDPAEQRMAHIVATGCMGGDHLWQDLGLWNRKDLSALMDTNFPTLAAKNHKDMKWKKFLYKQLCESEGIYVCRSPSCEVCPDYDNCFGPEE
ncbi:MAG: nitrogen fixation protein NifQ [Gammaproteobacteria bacterium]